MLQRPCYACFEGFSQSFPCYQFGTSSIALLILLNPACTILCVGQRIRVVGSGLSPNGMAFCPQGMLSTALLDEIISVDTEKQQVTVQAGARVQQVFHIHNAFLTCFSPCEARSSPLRMQASMYGLHHYMITTETQAYNPHCSLGNPTCCSDVLACCISN